MCRIRAACPARPVQQKQKKARCVIRAFMSGTKSAVLRQLLARNHTSVHFVRSIGQAQRPL